MIVVMKKSDLGQVGRNQEFISHVKDMVHIGVRIQTKKMKKGRDINLLEQKSVDVHSLWMEKKIDKLWLLGIESDIWEI